MSTPNADDPTKEHPWDRPVPVLNLDKHGTLLFFHAEQAASFAEAHIAQMRNSLNELRNYLSGL